MMNNVCNDCGALNYPTSFTPTCSVRIAEKHVTVIDGQLYTVGNRPKGSTWNGMAGRRFDIEYFDGRTVTTYDLWSGGEIPEKYREQIPDTARFLNGAGYVKVGDGGCWNSSKS